MPANPNRAAALFDQFEDERSVTDWGGDDLFTRMPRPRPVDNAPAPRFRPSLALVDPPAERRSEPGGDEWSGPRDRRATPTAVEREGERRSGEQAMRERAERLGLSLLELELDGAGAAATDEIALPPRDVDSDEFARRWDEDGNLVSPPSGRRTKVITGHPGGAPRPLPTVRQARRRPAKTTAEWIGPRPERIVGWAVALGLLLILIAIIT